MKKKRSLDLLPEILPKPTFVAGPSSVRARALARLSVLAALSAASSGCGGSGGSGEDGPYGVVDPLPRPSGGSGGRDRTPSTNSGTGSASGVVDLLPEPAVCYTLGLPDARARYVDDAVSAGRDAGVADVDAGSSDAGSDADAGADGGADGGAVQRLVQVRVELLFPTAPTSLGQAVPRTAGVAVLEVGGAGLSATLLLSIPEGGAASVELPLVCQRQTYQLRVDLQLQPRSVEVSVTFG